MAAWNNFDQLFGEILFTKIFQTFRTAIQFARDEKPGLQEAIRFSSRWDNFRSFFTAPLVPVGIVLFLGFWIYLLGLIGDIPWAGEVLMAILIGLALIAAALYGAVCYLFVRLFVFVLLWVTHGFLHLGIFVDSSKEGVGKLAAIWPGPTFFNLVGFREVTGLNAFESFAGFVIHLAVLIVTWFAASFVISFYFSASTIIYALMRKLVDDTPIKEVHAEPEVRESE